MGFSTASPRATALAILLAMALAMLSACAKPLPPERLDYVGRWRGPGVELLIRGDGHIAYKRSSGGSSTSIEAPIQAFEGDDFTVGIGPLGTRFDVTAPPREIDGVWRMTVDGVELIRSDEPLEKTPEDNDKLISA